METGCLLCRRHLERSDERKREVKSGAEDKTDVQSAERTSAALVKI